MNHVIDFQSKNGLKPDGIIGKNTMLKMCEVWGVNRIQLLHMLANTHHETGGFKVDTENLNYSAKGLRATFPKYFTDTEAREYANKPEKIANKVYAYRMGNGNPASGDGWKYRGRGSLQLTGKNNYTDFGKLTGNSEILSNPDIVASDYFWQSALYYFERNKLWAKMKNESYENIKLIRKAVNGGVIGLNDVVAKFNYYSKLFS